MIDKFYLENPESYPVETPEEIRARERAYLVRWMRSVVAHQPEVQGRKAFMNKVHSVASHHGITLEELLRDE
ncbi:MAG: hypothetical protein PHN64_06090 [Desulfovibrionaceae bacterium]|nr:hypothetical protein [Desulfovibrionaceae bacterium]